jgi:hypothetical protein
VMMNDTAMLACVRRQHGGVEHRRYAKLYARPGAMHAGFAHFAAFDHDAADNKAFFAAGKLSVPVLAVGGEKSFDTKMAAVMRFAASDVAGITDRRCICTRRSRTC